MITVGLIVLGLSILVFLFALRGAVAGRQDNLGFLQDPLCVLNRPPVVRASPITPAIEYTAPPASPWLRLSLQGQDELDLLEARTAIREKCRSPL